MSWIKQIPYQKAEGRLKKLFDRIKGPDNNIDNIMLVHSLRPHTMEGHMILYKNVLHNNNNTLPKWFIETVGLYVSILNRCDYCIDHHFEGLKRLLNDEEKADRIKEKLQTGSMGEYFEGKELSGLMYAHVLTKQPSKVKESAMETLRDNGYTDGEILELNQVIAYFSYANRTVLGLGVTPEGDILGLSPNDSEDPENWTHK